MRSKPLFIILGLLCLPFEVSAQLQLFNDITPDVLKNSGRTESAQVTVPDRTLPGGDNCDDGFASVLLKPIVANCSKSEFVNGNFDEFCKCMDNNSNLPANASIVAELENPPDHEIEKRRKYFTQKILHVYQQLNYGVSVQESIYSMNSGASKVAGCTGVEIAKTFMDEINDVPIVSLDDKDACQDPQSDECSTNIEKVKEEYRTKLKDFDAKKGLEASAEVCKIIRDKKPESEAVTRNDFSSFIDGLKNIREFYNKFPKLIDQKTRQSINDLLKTNFKDFSLDCSIKESLTKLKFEYDIKSQIIEDPVEVSSFENGNIASSIDESNEKISKAINLDYDHLKPNACISYKNFQVINAAPSQELLSSIGTSGSNFDISKINSSSEEMKFLRRNPVLAKLATTPEGSRFISEGLNKLKNSLGSNSSHPQRVEAFSRFMKNDVAQFSRNYGLNDVHLCRELGKSLSRVFSTDDIPYTKSKSGHVFDAIRDNYHFCRERSRERSGVKEVTELEENLANNPFYKIMDKDLSVAQISTNLSADFDQEYNSFISKNCIGFQEHKKQHLGKCDGPLSFKGCYDKFNDLSKAKTKQLLASYYADVNPELGKLIAIAEGETKDPTKKDLDKRTTEKFQDKEVKDHYRKKVLPKLASTSSSSASGSANTQAEVQKVLASEQASYNETHDKSFATPKSKGPVNDNQVVPKAARLMENQPAPLATPITPETFRSVKRGTEFLDRNLTDPNERLSDISRKQQSVEAEAESLMNLVNSDKERSEIIKQEKQILADLEREKKQILKEIGDASSRSPSGIFQSPIVDESYSSGSPVQTSGRVQPFVPQGRAPREDVDQKAAMNKALLDTKYVSNPMGTVLLGNQYADLPPSKHGIEVVKSIDVNMNQFEAIKNAESLEELNSLIAKQLSIPYKDPAGVIAIVDPKSGNEMFFEVTPEDGGNRIKVKLVSNQTKVEPKIRRKFERKTLKGFFTQTP